MSHPTGRPHQVALRFIARDDSSSISGNLPSEVVLDKGVNLGVLHDYVLERVAHVTCPSTVSMSRDGEGRGCKKGHRIRTALVEGVARTVSEAVRTRDLREPSDHAEPLYPLQEGRVWQLLVGRDLPPIGRPDRLAEDGDIGQFGFRYKASCSWPGRISSSLILSADVRLGAKSALSVKMRPGRATCGLRTRDGSKMTSGSGNVFLDSL